MVAQNRSQLTTEVSTNFPDNTTGLITPAISRTTFNDFITSFAVLADANVFAPTSGVAITINGLATATQSLAINQSPSFTLAGASFVANAITLTDTAHLDVTRSVNGLTVNINTGAWGGARQAITGNVTTTGLLDVATKDAFMVGGAFGAFANGSTGGTDTGANARGSYCGINPVVSVAAGVTNIKGIKGGEVDISSGAGSTMGNRIGWDIVLTASLTGGATLDRGVQFSCDASSLGWNQGITFDNFNGGAPVRSTGALIASVGSWTVGSGIDLSSLTITTAAFKSNGFTVDGSGNITAPQNAGGSTASSTLTLESTTGAGTTDAIIFKTASQVERMRVTTGGLVNIGPNAAPDALLTVNSNTAAASSAVSGAVIHVLGSDGLNPTTIAIDGYGGQPNITGRRAQGTQGAKTAVVTSSALLTLIGSGWDGSAYSGPQADIVLAASENWNGTSHGASVAILTTPNTTTALATAATFQASGCLSVGTAVDTGINSLSSADVYSSNATFLIRTKATLTNSAAANTATLTNAPTAGNPTKWFSIDDNGTTRRIPAW